LWAGGFGRCPDAHALKPGDNIEVAIMIDVTEQ
jgi:hypothetical protein